MKSKTFLFIALAIVNLQELLASDDCSKFDQCKIGEKQFRTCSCRKDCHKFGDCCSDAHDKNDEKQFDCKNDRYTTPVYAMRTCLDEFDAHIDNKHICENASADRADILGNILVTSTRTKTTYWNKHCGLCNNEDIDDLHYWTTQVSCPSKPEAKKFSASFIEKHLTYNKELEEWGLKVDDGFVICNLIFHKPRKVTPKQLHYCAPNLISKCPPGYSDSEIIEKCSMFHAERKQKHENVYFKNVYCALCNGVSEEELSCVGRSYGPVPQMSGKHIVKVMFEGDWLDREEIAEKYKCSTNNTWDPFNRRCQPLPEDILREMWETKSVSHSQQVTLSGILVFIGLALSLIRLNLQ